MGRTFTLKRDYYEDKIYIYKQKNMTINPGVTVLVGCNGCGKTTFINHIEKQLEKEKIPVIKFDNLYEGGHNSISEAMSNFDYSFVSDSWHSSEGERIVLNIGQLASRLRNFVENGIDSKNQKFIQLAKSIENLVKSREIEDTDNDEISNERWILLDAVDSGLSVDNIVDLKNDLFDTILKYNFGKEIYIIVSANEYEMARESRCFDVHSGKYIEFKNYDDYRNFILKSKEIKNKRYDNK